MIIDYCRTSLIILLDQNKNTHKNFIHKLTTKVKYKKGTRSLLPETISVNPFNRRKKTTKGIDNDNDCINTGRDNAR